MFFVCWSLNNGVAQVEIPGLTPEERKKEEAESAKKWNAKLHKQVLLNNLVWKTPLVDLVPLMLAKPEAFRNLDLVDEQKRDLKRLHEKYSAELTKLLGKDQVGDSPNWANLAKIDWTSTTPGSKDKFYKLKKAYANEILDIFLPQQLQGFSNTGLADGLPKILTESPVGEILELSKEQKERIQIKSNKLAKEIEEFVQKTRQQAADIALEELTESQRKKLYAVYGKAQIHQHFAEAQTERLFMELVFKSGVSRSVTKVGPKNSKIWWTPVDLPGDAKK